MQIFMAQYLHMWEKSSNFARDFELTNERVNE